MELVGLPENTNGEDLEELVVEAFEVGSVKIKKRDFHASSSLNLLTEEMPSTYSETKKKLRELNKHNKNKLKSTKI